jgi:hypothetical protein
MTLPRFRLWMLMVAVAVVAMALGGPVVLMRRRADFLRLADHHRVRVQWRGVNGGTGATPWTDSRGQPVTERRSAWHHAMSLKYEHAAERPWLPVPPDPPPP